MNKKSVTRFFKDDKPAFAEYDNIRKLPNWIDGLKISQRKLLWTAFEKASKEFVKSETFANITALDTVYVHGAASLCSVLASLVQEFPGACNYQYLAGNSGGWGCRMLPRESAPRYTRVKIADISKILFDRTDREILERQFFEGQYIEPQYMVPIFPTVFLNCSEGLSLGFASKVYSRDPRQVIKYIKDRLAGRKSSANLAPWFKNFKGTVRRNEELQTYECVGVVRKNNMNSYTVSELPIGMDYTRFIEALDKMVEDHEIQDYEDKCDSKTDEILFEIKTTREFTKKHDSQASVEKFFKLVKNLPENLTCIDEHNRACEFKGVREMLDAFVEIRLAAYQRRKDYLLGRLKEQLAQLSSKYLFVKGIVDDEIVVSKKKKDEIVAQLEKLEKIQKVDGGYDYLLSMQISSLTHEKLEQLRKQIQEGKDEFRRIKETSVNDMWLNDLAELEKYL